ncbi:H-2 class II histocompatibility antigen, A-K beta chain-like [Limanda limanda]|uniref:H-2 class II histocompatibility antigen, A-K beta chain-like n=1 Tax=Limanda limanda TaxID=27771 RepID=UPI0029C7FBD2|nr:H-2 class II histocompatibility antigen, A-K beta chain-like [Limanda limanda]
MTAISSRGLGPEEDHQEPDHSRNQINTRLKRIQQARASQLNRTAEAETTQTRDFKSQDERRTAQQLSPCSRTVPPVVRVHHTEPADYGARTFLHCSVLGFYPQKVQVSWLRDGMEVSSDVSSTDVLANEDWSFIYV